MNPRLKFITAVAACALLVAGAAAAVLALAWSTLASGQQVAVRAALAEALGALLLVSLLLLAIIGMLLHAAIRAYVARPLKLAEETRLILGANPRHRIECSWPRELQQLAAAINALAARCESLQTDVAAQVAEAGRDLEGERNLLAALMADLTESVIVCNVAGTILLYNERARQLFDGTTDGRGLPRASDWIGLGRSLFAGIEREVVAHAIDQLHHRLREGDRFPISEFVTATGSGRLFRARMAAVASDAASGVEAPGLSGFVLVLHDVQREVDLGIVRERVLNSLTEGTRASLAGIRAAAETVMHYPGMDASQQRKFLDVIHDEAEKLGGRLEASLSDDASRVGAEWPLTTMLGRDLIRALRRSVAARCACTVAAEACGEPVWTRVDSFLLTEGISHLALRLQRAGRSQDMTLRLVPSGTRIRLDLCWSRDALDVEQALERENEPFPVPGHPQPLSFKQIVARHGGEVWYQNDTSAGRSCFCILLPAAEPEAPAAAPASSASRPIFYDFDLFHQGGQSLEIDQRPLNELAYTVFDTETTGLQPSQGDEIIAIGAVRIVNERLLTGETFEQLVNPHRNIEKASTRIHGLTNAMLTHQPDIKSVLPRFHRFCENTVLVAHNAAFDMRFLQLKEHAAGVTFSHPVLDTLMLSAVVHPNQTDHSLEAISARLGVNVIGRHTALGDALVAGEIFAKLLPLLRQQGIVTFREAYEAARKTAFARLSY